MKSMALIMAVVGIMAGAVWAAPTYQYSWVDLGGGLYGFTFTCDNTGEAPSAWFVEMEWRGADPGEEVFQPGTLNQIQGFGVIDVHEENEADTYDAADPG